MARQDGATSRPPIIRPSAHPTIGFEAFARMEGTELLTSVLSALLDPVEGPEFELLTWEGAGAKVLELPPLEREIVRGHNWVLDTNGRLLEHGSLVRESSENPWAYRLQRPDEYATQTIISLVAVVGPHHVNA